MDTGTLVEQQITSLLDPLKQEQTAFAKSLDLSLEEFLLLSRTLSTADLYSVCELLRCKKFRSQFRQRASGKVRLWLKDPDRLGPLNPIELKWIAPKWPIHWKLPGAL